MYIYNLSLFQTEEELVQLRTRQINARKYEEVSNVAEVVFSYEGAGTDKEIVNALDKKYDALMDKLILDSLKNQLGNVLLAFCYFF